MLALNSHATLFGRSGMAVDFKLMQEKNYCQPGFCLIAGF